MARRSSARTAMEKLKAKNGNPATVIRWIKEFYKDHAEGLSDKQVKQLVKSVNKLSKKLVKK